MKNQTAKSDEKSRIGVLGGTFDPPHLGHLALAISALSQMNLNRVLWVLTPNSPRKTDTEITQIEHRIRMVQLAIKEYPLFELSLADVLRPAPYYAVDTLKILTQQNPEADLIYLIGSDLLKIFPNWVGIQQILELCQTIGVAYRSDCSPDIEKIERVHPEIFTKIQFIKTSPIEVSSHKIRSIISDGTASPDGLPSTICEYIKKHGLYAQWK